MSTSVAHICICAPLKQCRHSQFIPSLSSFSSSFSLPLMPSCYILSLNHGKKPYLQLQTVLLKNLSIAETLPVVYGRKAAWHPEATSNRLISLPKPITTCWSFTTVLQKGSEAVNVAQTIGVIHIPPLYFCYYPAYFSSLLSSPTYWLPLSPWGSLHSCLNPTQ